MTHKEEPDYTYWERDEDGRWCRHEDKYLVREKLYSTTGVVEPQWYLPQLLQSEPVAQGKWLLLTGNLCSVAQVVLLQVFVQA
jgi:hypothetical protein